MQITLDLPEELVSQLNAVEDRLDRVLELGLRQLNASDRSEFSGTVDVLEFLASLPTPEEIIALRPSATLQEQIDDLLEKNRDRGLAPEEEKVWQQYQYLEHLVRMAKAKALMKKKEAIAHE